MGRETDVARGAALKLMLPSFLFRRASPAVPSDAGLPVRISYSVVPPKAVSSTSGQGNHNAPHDLHATTNLENGKGSNHFDGTQLPDYEREADGKNH